MKRIFFSLMFVVTLTFANTCAAEDVWVKKWHSQDVDLYVMVETIDGSQTETGNKHFTVSTKVVRNGQLQEVLNWKFNKFRTDDWEFTHSGINDNLHMYKIVYREPLFEYCMEKLGWSYRVVDRNGVKHYH